ncbi:MAG: phosphoglucosamine mutase [Dehalococcoidia bacterium]|nr:phosphoglucosamine mutase [Dehalococcoidia bacterium]
MGINTSNKQRLFGTSGIRGVVNRGLSPDFCRQVALAMGTTLPQYSTVCIATDTRVSREVIKGAVVSGLLSSNINVVDLGILPTPALALLTRQLGFDAGIMVTASHNPPEFNGIKLFTGDSLGYSQAQEAEIEKVYFSGAFRQGGKGSLEHVDSTEQEYLSFIKDKLPLPGFNHQLRIVVDPGNGAASKFASDIFAQMGLTIIPINDEPDGLFPGRNPEPREDTLWSTMQFLREENADLAVCFDGDADRVVFCDQEGFLGFNKPVAFISRLVVEETGKRKVATTVEAGKLLDLAVNDLGVEVVRGKVGDVNVAYLARELDAALGVEQVGVYILPQAGYYPDSIFASLILLSHLSHPSQIREFFQCLPTLSFEKARVSCPNELKETVMAQLRDSLLAPSPRSEFWLKIIDRQPEINNLDGLRLEFADSWMLVRASGTEPAIRVIAESGLKAQADELISEGKKLVQSLVEVNQ